MPKKAKRKKTLAKHDRKLAKLEKQIALLEKRIASLEAASDDGVGAFVDASTYVALCDDESPSDRELARGGELHCEAAREKHVKVFKGHRVSVVPVAAD